MVSSDPNEISFKTDSQLARVNPLPYLRVQPTCGFFGWVVRFERATTSPDCLDAGDAGFTVSESRGEAEQAAEHKTRIQDMIVETILAELAFPFTACGRI